jgi:hypothetical protein
MASTPTPAIDESSIFGSHLVRAFSDQSQFILLGTVLVAYIES